MRLGFCASGNLRLADSPAISECDQIRTMFDNYRYAKEIGYDYIEFGVANFAAMSEEDMEKAVQYHNQGLLTVESCNGFIPATLPLVGDQVDVDAVRAYLQKVLPRMASVGVETVVFGSGGARRVPEGISDEQAWQQLDAFMTMAEEIARPLGITIVIEPLNHKETNVMLTVAKSYQVAKRLNLPNLKVLGDTYHMYIEGEDPSILTECADLLRHIHVAEPVERGIPVDCPYLRQTGEALRKAGYDGRVTIECRHKNFVEDIKNVNPLMREMF